MLGDAAAPPLTFTSTTATGRAAEDEPAAAEEEAACGFRLPKRGAEPGGANPPPLALRDEELEKEESGMVFLGTARFKWPGPTLARLLFRAPPTLPTPPPPLWWC